MVSDCSLEKSLKLQILSSHFRLLQICVNWQFASVVDNIASAEEENAAADASAKEEEDIPRNDL